MNCIWFCSQIVRKLYKLPAEVVASRLTKPLLARFVLLDTTADECLLPHLLTPCQGTHAQLLNFVYLHSCLNRLFLGMAANVFVHIPWALFLWGCRCLFLRNKCISFHFIFHTLLCVWVICQWIINICYISFHVLEHEVFSPFMMKWHWKL